LVKVYQRWNRIDHGNGIVAYAHRCVVTAVLDQARKPWRREHSHEADESALVMPDATGPVNDRLLVMQALSALPPSQRACVVLRHYTGLSLQQTADILGIGVGGVKSQTSRGLTHLRELLDLTERSAT
jgi:RNA polymerase sigma factor (sigma-70 family)